jgi:hypothetical protein
MKISTTILSILLCLSLTTIAYSQDILSNRNFKNFKTELFYRGSRDGFTPEQFHARCNNKGHTFTLFRIKDGPCVAGYTKI